MCCYMRTVDRVSLIDIYILGFLIYSRLLSSAVTKYMLVVYRGVILRYLNFTYYLNNTLYSITLHFRGTLYHTSHL